MTERDFVAEATTPEEYRAGNAHPADSAEALLREALERLVTTVEMMFAGAERDPAMQQARAALAAPQTRQPAEPYRLPCGHDAAQQWWGRCRKCGAAAEGSELERCDYICWMQKGHDGPHVMTGMELPLWRHPPVGSMFVERRTYPEPDKAWVRTEDGWDETDPPPNPVTVKRIATYLWGEDIVNIRAAVESFANGYTVVPKETEETKP